MRLTAFAMILAALTVTSEPISAQTPALAALSSSAQTSNVAAGPLGSKWFAGPAVGRNFEREAFILGMEFGLLWGPQAFGTMIWNLELNRTGLSNGTLWGFAPGVGVVPSSLTVGNQIMTRFIASVIYNRFSSEVGSGGSNSDVGAMLSAGVLYGMSMHSTVAADLAAQRVGGFTAFLVTFTLLFGPGSPGAVSAS